MSIRRRKYSEEIKEGVSKSNDTAFYHKYRVVGLTYSLILDFYLFTFG